MKNSIEMASYDLYTIYHTIGSRIQAKLLLPQHIERLFVLVLLMGGICEVRRWEDGRWHGTHNRFHEYVAGIQKLVGGA
jgi:hypothetical protein